MHLCSLLSIKHAPLCTENEEERSRVGEIIQYLSRDWNFESGCEGAGKKRSRKQRGGIYRIIHRIPFCVLHAQRDKFLKTNIHSATEMFSRLPNSGWHKWIWNCILQLSKFILTKLIGDVFMIWHESGYNLYITQLNSTHTNNYTDVQVKELSDVSLLCVCNNS